MVHLLRKSKKSFTVNMQLANNYFIQSRPQGLLFQPWNEGLSNSQFLLVQTTIFPVLAGSIIIWTNSSIQMKGDKVNDLFIYKPWTFGFYDQSQVLMCVWCLTIQESIYIVFCKPIDGNFVVFGIMRMPNASGLLYMYYIPAV